MNRVSFRRAKKEDAGAIAQIHYSSSNDLYLSLFGSNPMASFDVKSRERYWANQIHSTDQGHPGNFILVADAQSLGPLGFIAITLSQDYGEKPSANLNSIYILSEFCGRGIGKSLFKHSVNWLVAKKVYELDVWVLEKNPACKFYESLGGKRLESINHLQIASSKALEVAYKWDLMDVKAKLELSPSSYRSMTYEKTFFKLI